MFGASEWFPFRFATIQEGTRPECFGFGNATRRDVHLARDVQDSPLMRSDARKPNASTSPFLDPMAAHSNLSGSSKTQSRGDMSEHHHQHGHHHQSHDHPHRLSKHKIVFGIAAAGALIAMVIWMFVWATPNGNAVDANAPKVQAPAK